MAQKDTKKKAIQAEQKDLDNHQYQKRRAKTCEIIHEIFHSIFMNKLYFAQH